MSDFNHDDFRKDKPGTPQPRMEKDLTEPTYNPSPLELLAGEIASDVFPWVPEQTLDKLVAIREAVQRRLDCAEGRKLILQIAVDLSGSDN
jgi:hypothetical protein